MPMTKEQRSAAARKAAATRKRNREAQAARFGGSPMHTKKGKAPKKKAAKKAAPAPRRAPITRPLHGGRSLTHVLMRIGGEYERAVLARDFERGMDIERRIQHLAETEENYVPSFIVRGRNHIRKLRGLELLNF